MIRPVVALLCGALLAPVAAAQQDVEVLDRIAAIVGQRAILVSEVEEEFVQAQAQAQSRNQPFPADSAARMALRREILRQMVDQEILVQEARRDTSVRVTEQEIQEAVEQTVQNVRGNFRSETEFRQQLSLAGFTSSEEWRRWLADNQRRQIYAQRLIEIRRQSGKLKPIPPTEEQMRAFFEANRGAQTRPPVVSFRQIVITPQPDSAARRAARATADSLLTALRAGADFAEAARQFSDDSASAVQGGELGWFRRGVMVKEFERVAFAMRPGQISPVVETEFGFHVIKVERTQPAEVFARHILIMPEVSAEEVARARSLADSLHTLLAAGVGFDSLARANADPKEPKLADDAPFANLPPEYQTAIGDAQRGLLPVFVLGAGTERPKFVVLELTDRQEAGPVRFEDVRDRIRQNLSQQLGIEHFLNQLRRQMYVDVRL